jgi:hypothetical protein
MTSIFYGEGKNGAPDPSLITYDSQFCLAWTAVRVVAGGGPTLSTGEVILSIPTFFTPPQEALYLLHW